MRQRQTATKLKFEALEERTLLSTTATNIGTVVPNSLIVQWSKEPAGTANLVQGIQNLGNNEMELTLKPGVTVAQAQAYFQSQPGVIFAQPDTIVADASIASSVPNDPDVGLEWALQNINAQAAWNVTTGTGNITIAEIDSGIDYTQPDLAANLLPGLSYNFITNTTNAMDDNGHGSVVAGIMGAVGNNGIGVAGVDWNVKIMALKFLDASGSGDIANAVAALNYAVAHGAKIVNMSFEGGGYNPAMASAIQNAQTHGVLIVAAAGNDNHDDDYDPTYPADYTYSNVITVAAITSNNQLASFSNFGPATVDLGAPGVDIYSTSNNNGYVYDSGTSMAAPFVSGAAALIWGLHPSWTDLQVIQDIEQNVDPIPALQSRTVTGGKLDIGKAVLASMGTGSTTHDGAAITASAFSGPAANSLSSASITFNEAINPATFTPGAVTLTGPTGANIPISSITAVAGSNNTQFIINFGAQTAGGIYRLSVGPDIQDTYGDFMDQNRNGVNGETSDVYTSSTTLTLPTPNPTAPTSGTFGNNTQKTINGLNTITSTIAITQNIAITNLSVQLNLVHNDDGDVSLTLIGPNGQMDALIYRRGGTGLDFSNTVLDSRSGTPIATGTAPFVGNFKPDQSLNLFAGTSSLGTWTLQVRNMNYWDSGRLLNWSLIVNGVLTSSYSEGNVSAASVSGSVPVVIPDPVSNGNSAVPLTAKSKAATNTATTIIGTAAAGSPPPISTALPTLLAKEAKPIEKPDWDLDRNWVLLG